MSMERCTAARECEFLKAVRKLRSSAAARGTYAKKKQPDMAISSFKQALNLMPSKKVGEYGSVMAKAYIDSARSAIDNGEFTKAKQLLISAEKLVSDNVTVSHLLGVISIHEKKGRQAYDYLVKALKAQPANANILVDFARANILIGDYENALRTWNAVIEMAPGYSAIQAGSSGRF